MKNNKQTETVVEPRVKHQVIRVAHHSRGTEPRAVNAWDEVHGTVQGD